MKILLVFGAHACKGRDQIAGVWFGSDLRSLNAFDCHRYVF